MDCKYSNGALPATSLALSLLLAACGGGGGGGGDNSTADTTDPSGGTNEPATRLKAGRFNTTVTYENSPSRDGLTILSPTGRFASALQLTQQELDAGDRPNISFGEYKFDNGEISGSATDFIYIVDNESWVSSTGEIDGTVEAPGEGVLGGEASNSSTSINLKRQPDYSDQGVTLSELSGTYTQSGNTLHTSITVDSGGTVTGNGGENGCQVFTGENGGVTIPDTSLNVFEIKYTVANCKDEAGDPAPEKNGEFSGVGTFDSEDSRLEFLANNEEIAVLFSGARGPGG